MNNEGINATLYQSADGDADVDVSIEPTKEELDALAAVQNTIESLKVDPAEKIALSTAIENLLELLKQREQKIFDTAAELAFEACKRMIESTESDDADL